MARKCASKNAGKQTSGLERVRPLQLTKQGSRGLKGKQVGNQNRKQANCKKTGKQENQQASTQFKNPCGEGRMKASHKLQEIKKVS